MGKNDVRHITKEQVYQTPMKLISALVQSSKADGKSKEVIVRRIRQTQ